MQLTYTPIDRVTGEPYAGADIYLTIEHPATGKFLTEAGLWVDETSQVYPTRTNGKWVYDFTQGVVGQAYRAVFYQEENLAHSSSYTFVFNDDEEPPMSEEITSIKEQAKSYLTLHAQVSVDPTLTEDEQDALILQARIADKNGRGINDPDYAETYDIPTLLYNAWMVKAAKASAAYAISDSELSLHREQVHDHCLKQSEHWKSQMAYSISNLEE